jgi:hypothetical protein
MKVIPVILMAGVGLGAFIALYLGERHRAIAIRALATRLGFHYLGNALPRSLTLSGTPFGHLSKAWNVIDGQHWDARSNCSPSVLLQDFSWEFWRAGFWLSSSIRLPLVIRWSWGCRPGYGVGARSNLDSSTARFVDRSSGFAARRVEYRGTAFCS